MKTVEEFEAWQDGYLDGFEDAHKEVESATPPWLRRFFWWDRDGLTSRFRPLYLGTDEYCNDTIGIRLWGGVLLIRRNWTVRLEPDPDCPKCEGNACGF